MGAQVTTPDKLIELALRVEQASQGSRELDASIAATLRIGTDQTWAKTNYPRWLGSADGRVHLEKSGPSFESPAYTSSLDAAMQLASDPRLKQFGGALGMLREALDRLYAAGLKDDALARFWTAACLRALSHQGGQNG